MMEEKPLTAQRDLRHARPLWAETPRISVRARKHVPPGVFDVIIVGAGISGALMAEALADGHRSILILDRRGPVKGSSMASTAMIQHEIDVPLGELAGMIGRQRARRVWRRSAAAVDSLIALAHDLDLDCGMERKQTLYLAGDAYGARALKTEVRERNAAGLKADYLDAAELHARYGIGRTAAIVSVMSASANPAQLTAGILRAACGRGAQIVSGIEITDVRGGSDGVCLATSDGRLIAGRHAVFCTGYEFLAQLASKRHSVISTWAIASRAHRRLPEWLSGHLVWEGSDPYLYLRATGDGRLIAGGEDEKDPEAHRSEDKLRRKSALIAEKVGDLLGLSMGKPEFSWAAAFGITNTGLPLIGAVPGLENVFSVMGFGGNGITFSKIAAEIVSGAINGRADPDGSLFAFSRDGR